VSTQLKPLPPPLPSNIGDWQRAAKSDRTLNDQVEDIHRVLVEDADYRSYLRAVWDEQAVEGSLAADNIMAATLIRNKAKMVEGSDVGKEKLATIAKALGIVLRRYRASRKERRHMVHGEVVDGDNGGE
jgi:hypothetical protein